MDWATKVAYGIAFNVPADVLGERFWSLEDTCDMSVSITLPGVFVPLQPPPFVRPMHVGELFAVRLVAVAEDDDNEDGDNQEDATEKSDDDDDDDFVEIDTGGIEQLETTDDFDEDDFDDDFDDDFEEEWEDDLDDDVSESDLEEKDDEIEDFDDEE